MAGPVSPRTQHLSPIASNKHVGQGLKLNFALPGGPDLSKAKIKDDEHSLYLGKQGSSATPNSLKSNSKMRTELLDQDQGDQLREYEANIKVEREKYQMQAKIRSDAI